MELVNFEIDTPALKNIKQYHFPTYVDFHRRGLSVELVNFETDTPALKNIKYYFPTYVDFHRRGLSLVSSDVSYNLMCLTGL